MNKVSKLIYVYCFIDSSNTKYLLLEVTKCKKVIQTDTYPVSWTLDI